jgi:hypothetical protein
MKNQRTSESIDSDTNESFEVSVYIGRQRLGRLVRAGNGSWKAYDARDRLLGRFPKRSDAWDAVGGRPR